MSRGNGIVHIPPVAVCFVGTVAGHELRSQIPSARWDRSQRGWVISEDDLRLAWSVVRWHHPEARLVDEDGNVLSEPEPLRQKDWWGRQVQKRPASVSTWADQMYAAIPERLHADLTRALAKVLHPDANGDAACLQALIDARDRLG